MSLSDLGHTFCVCAAQGMSRLESLARQRHGSRGCCVLRNGWPLGRLRKQVSIASVDGLGFVRYRARRRLFEADGEQQATHWQIAGNGHLLERYLGQAAVKSSLMQI